MKRYYSAIKPFYKRKRLWPFHRLLEIIISGKYKNKVSLYYHEQFPKGESVVILANHALDYGPLIMHYNHPRHKRPWVNSNLLHIKAVPNHIRKDFFINETGIKKFLIKIMSYIIAPLIATAFRSIEAIPVYHDTRIKTTFRKNNETLIEGLDVIIFPESKQEHPEYKYVNKLQEGFVLLGANYYNETGRRVKYYPTYINKDLGVISYGKPIAYDPSNSSKEERQRIINYTCQEIERLANLLPPHTPTPHGKPPATEEAVEEFNKRKAKVRN